MINKNFPNIVIHANDECAFRCACRNERLHVVKCLIKNFPNINIHAMRKMLLVLHVTMAIYMLLNG